MELFTGKPRTPKEIAEIFGVTEKRYKGNRKFRDIMTKENCKKFKATQSSEYVDRKK